MKQPNVVISVVMGVYNAEKYLQKAIDSILNQTFHQFEFIIVNDGSTDSSLNILRSYNDIRVRVINQKNSGLPVALNQGISFAQGRYIARMDADDIALPNRFEIQLAYMESHPEISVVGGQVALINSEGSPIGKAFKPLEPEIIDRYLNYACPLIHPTYLARKEVYKIVKGYRESLRTAQDYDFLLRASEAGLRFANVPDEVLLYRDNPSGISASSLMRQARSARILLSLHKQRLKGKPEPSKLLAQLQRTSFRSTWWFKFLFKFRKKLITQSKQAGGFYKLALLLLVILVSSLHIELFRSSWRTQQALNTQRTKPQKK